jgi:hypothetical protein
VAFCPKVHRPIALMANMLAGAVAVDFRTSPASCAMATGFAGPSFPAKYGGSRPSAGYPLGRRFAFRYNAGPSID